MKNFETTRHIYSIKIELNGETTTGITYDSQLKRLINEVYNSDDPSEVKIRASINLMMNGLLPGVVINDYKDGGRTTIAIIK